MDMMISNQQNKLPFGSADEELLCRVLERAAAILDLPDGAELSVVIMDDPGIQELNRQYRGLDQPTDVLSFAMLESGEDEPEYEDPAAQIMLGDIVISLERAEEQSRAYGHSRQRELAFLFVHGLLHLAGYDHRNAGEEKTMLEKQEEILSGMGLSRD